MSHAVEGLDDSGLDPEELFAALAGAHGPAVAPIGDPIEAILVDRRALSWPDLLAWLAEHVRQLGAWGLSWDETDPTPIGVRTLSYER
jgi:hypothetical protein